MNIHPPFSSGKILHLQMNGVSFLTSYVCLLFTQVFIYLLVSIYLPIYLYRRNHRFLGRKRPIIQKRSSAGWNVDEPMSLGVNQNSWKKTSSSRWWFHFKYFLFSSLLGETIRFDWYFSNGLKPPTSHAVQQIMVVTFPEKTNIFALKNGWLEFFCFLLGWVISRGELLVLGRVIISLIRGLSLGK